MIFLRRLASLLALAMTASAFARPDASNVILIVADDLGWGELGSYGQAKIRTPNLDRLAAEGMRFTQFYSGSPVCASSRCTLLSGLHTGHAFIRNNREIGGWERGAKEGQLPVPAGTCRLPALFRARDATSGVIGKWGLGGPESPGAPNRQGFDHWYGYLCQRLAHNYYPEYLWRNDAKVPLDNAYFPAHQRIETAPATIDEYDRYRGTAYAADLMADEAVQFVTDHATGRFFLLYATPVPHVALQVPADSLDEYPVTWDETPYLGDKGYLPHPRPRAAYAAMITRMDRDVGRLLDRLDTLGIADETVVMFTSDNGPTYAGGADAAFFDSAGGLRGLKGSVFEGGIRVPLIVRWPGHVPAGVETTRVGAFWDLLPTIAALTGAPVPGGVDGVSLAPTMLAEGEQTARTPLYWELGRQQSLRDGNWKLVRRVNKQGVTTTMLFDLERDPGEQHDLAGERPAELARMIDLAREARVPSAEFPSVFDRP